MRFSYACSGLALAPQYDHVTSLNHWPGCVAGGVRPHFLHSVPNSQYSGSYKIVVCLGFQNIWRGMFCRIFDHQYNI